MSRTDATMAATAGTIVARRERSGTASTPTRTTATETAIANR
jgi:hypothetical protein